MKEMRPERPLVGLKKGKTYKWKRLSVR
jgi:hypothetical protein